MKFDDKNSAFYPPKPHKPIGDSYAAWIKNWYEWVQSIPKGQNPVIDTTGKDCYHGQSGPVWFLVGTGGGTAHRACSIPAEKDIFFPIINELASTTQYNKKSQDLVNYCNSIIDQVNEKEVIFDSLRLQGSELDEYRAQSELFKITLPNNNLCGLAPGLTEAISDGYWLMIRKEALSAGKHSLWFRAQQSDGFKLEVLYDLNID
jgi:hypothetical protein